MATKLSRQYDVFLSYCDADIDRVRPIYEALVAAELTVYFAENRFTVWEELTPELKLALDRSRVVVGLASDAYLDSNPCGWEAVHTFELDMAAGTRRFGAMFLGPLNLQARGLQRYHLAEQVARDAQKAVKVVQGALLQAPSIPPKRERSMMRHADRSEGSGRELYGRHWQLAEIVYFLADHRRMTGGDPTSSSVVWLTGLGGMGKTAVADAFRRMFGGTFRVADVRFSAGGDAVRNKVNNDGDRIVLLTRMRDQFLSHLADLRSSLGEPAKTEAASSAVGSDLKALREDLKRIREEIVEAYERLERRDRTQGNAVLWIVDDVPNKIGDDKELLYCPFEERSLTVVTARPMGEEVPLDKVITVAGLSRSASRLLLLQHVKKTGEGGWEPFSDRLDGIAHALGGYPLALTLISARLHRTTMSEDLDVITRELQGEVPFLDDVVTDVLAEHENARSIAAVVGGSVRAVVTSAKEGPVREELLRILRLLALLPIEPTVAVRLLDEVLTHAMALVGRSTRTQDHFLVARGALDSAGLASGPGNAVDAKELEIHAMTRHVLRSLYLHDRGFFPTDAQGDDALAMAAASAFVTRGEKARDQDVIQGKIEFDRALKTMEFLQDTSELAYRLRCHARRGVGRAEVRAPATPPEGQTGVPQTLAAMDVVYESIDLALEGLALHPDSDDLLQEKYKAMALLGVLSGKLAPLADAKLATSVVEQMARRGLLEGLSQPQVDRDGPAESIAAAALHVAQVQADARQARAGRLGTDEALADAADAWMNLPTIHINAGKAAFARGDDAESRRRFDLAMDTYDLAHQWRLRVYRQPLGATDQWWASGGGPVPDHGDDEFTAITRTAACEYGFATTFLLRAQYNAGTADERLALLRRAKDPLLVSVRRRLLANNALDLSKSVILAAKVALAELALSDQDSLAAAVKALDEAQGSSQEVPNECAPPPAAVLAARLGELRDKCIGPHVLETDLVNHEAMVILLRYLGHSGPRGEVPTAVDAVKAAIVWLRPKSRQRQGLEDLQGQWKSDTRQWHSGLANTTGGGQ